MFRRLIEEYCANSTIHGLQFITERGRHWSERLLWTVGCAISWYGAWMLMAASVKTAQENPISFVVDTAHAKWDTTFPAISVCEIDNMQRVYNAADRLFSPDHDFNLDEILKEIAYFRGIASFTTEYCSDGDLQCPNGDLKMYTNEIRAPCKELFQNCSWNNEIFDCCSRFLPIYSEYGICFTVGSNQSTNDGPELPPLISNINTGPGKLKIELTAPVEIHWHSSADVPYFNKLTAESMLAYPNSLKRRSLAIRETVNEPAVRDVPWQRRRCLYPHEGDLKLYKFYSYSACVVECRQLAALRFCNCSSHLLPPIDGYNICNLKGLECLNKHYEQLTVLRGRWSARNEDYVTCDCLPECHEPDINLIVEENVQINDAISKVEIMLEYLPVERYQRVVVRSSLELVVSVGGTAGLFVGASILSAVELIYFFTVKLGCLFKHHVEARQARRKRHKRQDQDLVSWAWNRHHNAPRF